MQIEDTKIKGLQSKAKITHFFPNMTVPETLSAIINTVIKKCPPPYR